MARSVLVSAFCTLNLIFGAQVFAAEEAPSDGVAEAGKAGSGLAYDNTGSLPEITDNATISTGWQVPGVCSGDYCVYVNSGIANGRGVALVTDSQNFEKFKRIDISVFKAKDVNNYGEPPLAQVSDVEGGKLGLVASQALKRSKPLVAWSPVLLVHKRFLDATLTPQKEVNMVLEAAVNLLPEQTRKAFLEQSVPSKKVTKPTIKDIVLAHPFVTDFGVTQWNPDIKDENHYVNYPEASIIRHNCRPNVAFYIDQHHITRFTVVRKAVPGEELTISVIDPVQSRAERQMLFKENQGSGCKCSVCSGGGDLSAVRKSDARIEEIRAIDAELVDMDSKKVTVQMIDRWVQLYEEEGLQVRLARAYQMAAINYNNLGEDKLALKYANRAIQAEIMELGADSNDVIALRIMAKDIKGHYSYRQRLTWKGRGG